MPAYYILLAVKGEIWNILYEAAKYDAIARLWTMLNAGIYIQEKTKFMHLPTDLAHTRVQIISNREVLCRGTTVQSIVLD